jgi:hypothetical protein
MDTIEINNNLPNEKLYMIRHYKDGESKPYKDEYYIKYSKKLVKTIEYGNNNTSVEVDLDEETGVVISVRRLHPKSLYDILLHLYRRIFWI